jgi:hypothetical protein
MVSLQVIDKMTTSLETRFIKNPDLRSYMEANSVLTNMTDSRDELTQRCLSVANKFTDINPVALNNELLMLSQCRKNESCDIPAFKTVDDVMSFFGKRSIEYRSMFSEVLKLSILLAVVPATSATAERSFSCLKRIKTWLRTTMGQSRLNSLAVLHAHRHIEPQLDLVLNEFVQLNQSRERVFGRF